MSDPTPAAQELDDDLRHLMGGALFGSLAVKERVWGAAEGPPRSVEESRALYREPIVEAFAASGADSIAEFPARVRFLADAYYTLLHERDMAKAEANRYHAELVTLRESEHKAKMEVQALRKENADRKQLAADQQNAIESRVSESAHLRDLYGRTLAERDRYKALAEQQSATVAELRGQFGGALATVDELRADLTATRKAHADLTTAHAKTMAAFSSGSLADVEQARADLAKQVAELVKENDELRCGIRRLCRILGKAMAGDL